MQKLILALCLCTLLPMSAPAATKTTVDQLNKLMADMADSHKTDLDVATKLKEVELTEQLTTSALNGLVQYKPGTNTIRQLLLLSVDSSLLPPPPADLPTLPALDAPAQAALLRKATLIAAQSSAHLPKLTAEKQTRRFQNGIAYIKNNSGNASSMGDARGYAENPALLYLALMNQQTATIVTEAGVEQAPGIIKQKDPGGPLGQTSQIVPGLPLNAILLDLANSTPAWLRWQTINGRQTAVFTFEVPKNQSHYKINYCCFPQLDHIGSGMGFSSNSGSATTFNPFDSAPGYHGELYIDYATGLILRLITKAEPKQTEFVQQEDIRVDYSPVAVADTRYIVPVHSTILTTVVPNGDSYVQFSTRRTLFDVTYTKYQLAIPTTH